MSQFNISWELEVAVKEQEKARVALHGPSGSGKTFSILSIGQHMGDSLAIVDTERRSARLYADKFKFRVIPDRFFPDYHPGRLIDLLGKVGQLGIDVLGVDSLTHFWKGPGGFLALVDAEARRAASKGGNKYDSFGAWKAVDPLYNDLVQAILTAPAHVFVASRAKQEYEKVEVNGKSKIQKLGLAPQMRDDFQYELSVEGMLDIEHNLVIGKTRCDELDGKVFHKPGKDLADILLAWLNSGAPAAPRPASEPVKAQPAADPEWLVSLLGAIEAAGSLDELKAAQSQAQAHKADLVGPARARVLAASNAAKERLTTQAAE